MSKLNDNVFQQIDSRYMSVKRYNESDANLKRRKDPIIQEKEDKIIDDFVSKNSIE